MSGDERGEWWKTCKKMGGRLGKRGAHFKREGGTRREGCNKQWGREERKESDETRRMRTVERCRGSLRERAIYAGVWRGGRREGEKGVDEKEVISGLFLPAFC